MVVLAVHCNEIQKTHLTLDHYVAKSESFTVRAIASPQTLIDILRSDVGRAAYYQLRIYLNASLP